MTDVYIPRQSTPFSDILALLPSGSLSEEQRLEALRSANPQLKQCSVVRPGSLMLLPSTPSSSQQNQPHFTDLNRRWSALPSSARQAYMETNPAEMSAVLLALHGFMKDYGMVSAAGDLNTFGGGSVAGLAAQPSGLIKHTREIEGLLQQYADANVTQKAHYKQQVKAAYRRLHQQFGPILNRYVARAKANAKQPFLHSPNRALKAANKGHIMPLTNTAQNRTIFSTAKYLHWAGKGAAVLDIGFRTRNIVCSSNPFRQTAIEMAGLAGSFIAGSLAGTLGVYLVLGPLGWVALIVAAGIGAVVADYFLKTTVKTIWQADKSVSPQTTNSFVICR